MRRGGGAAIAAGLAVLLAGGAAPAQEPLPPGVPILVVDQDDMFLKSAFGRRIRAELEEASRALSAENRQLEGELTAEERALTDRRATIPPDQFRQEATEFDARVVRIRNEREAKSRELNRRVEQERKRFLDAALPVLEQLVTETGAVAVLDSRMVLLSSQSINVTDRAIARLDAVLGDGSATPGEAAPPVTPDPPQAPQTP